MSPHIPSSQVGIVVTKTLTFVLGGLITYFAYQAYQRTQAPELRALAIGFGIITTGSALGGLLHFGAVRFFDITLLLPIFVESLVMTVGLAIILYSLYVQQ